eukprot:GFKZ01001961.1.p1 GENE.GFKZ01001961.1~~GFKZ01001961.1.p1  ORF type:complete len:314 (-),score=46.62 GFKZ01001961.1:1113-2054(-)
MGNTSSSSRFLRRRQTEEPSPADLLYTKPSGLYSNCSWDVKTVRKLILRGELAPRYPGRDSPCLESREECPICMLVYPVLNQSKCCGARLCTECYLQIRPPRHNKEPCPFCKHRRFDAVFVGPKDASVLDEEERDQMRAADAMRRATLAAQEARHTEPTTTPTPNEAHAEGSSVVVTEVANTEGADEEQLERPCVEQHQPPFFHDPSAAIDPLLLEAMASEVTFASPAGSGADRTPASSSGLLDGHTRELRPDGESESDAESVSYLAEMRHRVVRLPWYGVDVDRANVASEASAFEEEKLSLNEAIRRSLIEM